MILQFHVFKDVRPRGRQSLFGEDETAAGTLHVIFLKRQEGDAVLLLALRAELTFPS